MKINLENMRENYEKSSLSKKDLHADPILQFAEWFKHAKAKVSSEANAMHLSTVTTDGQPEGRIVLLKSFSEDGFVFFTHYSSDKGKAIQANNKVALTFFWPELERQVRIEGLAQKISAQESDDYFYSRPVGSQIGANASPQSKVIKDYSVLEKAAEALSKEKTIARPEEWGGYCVQATAIEFWQGRPNRLHDRIKYKRVQAGWQIDRLAP